MSLPDYHMNPLPPKSETANPFLIIIIFVALIITFLIAYYFLKRE